MGPTHDLCFAPRTVIKPKKHPELGYHMQIFALVDIEPWVECFAPYSEEWWVPDSESPESERPIPEPHILTDSEYHTLHRKYESGILSLFTK